MPQAAQSLSDALHERLDAMGAPPRGRELSASEEPSEEESDDVRDDDLPGAEDESDSDDESEGEPAGELDSEEDEGEEKQGERQQYKVAELAEAIGWSPSELYTDLVVPLGNGESMTLEELKREGENRRNAQAEIEQARQQVQQQAQELQRQYQELISGAQGISEEIDNASANMRAIEAQYANVDWDRLEQQDAGRFAAYQQKFATAYARAKAQYEQAKDKHAQQSQNLRQQRIAAEQQKALSLVPDWRDPATLQKEQEGMTQYLLTKGATREDLAAIESGLALAVIRDAWLYYQQTQATAKAVDRMRKAPKQVVRAGRGTAKAVASAKVNELEKRAIRTGHPSDKLAAARAILQSSLARR